MPGRPARDGPWIKKNINEIRATVTRIRTNFHASGNQDADDMMAEWIKFSKFYSHIYTYIYALVDDGLMDQLGTSLPENIMRDTGASSVTARVYSTTVGATNRKRQRDRLKELQNGNASTPVDSRSTNSSNGSTNSSIGSSSNIGAIVKELGGGMEKQQSLQFLALNAPNSSVKNSAFAEIAKMAGIDTALLENEDH